MGRWSLRFACLLLLAPPSQAAWETNTGKWAIAKDQAQAERPGTLLSQEWYGAADFSGVVASQGDVSLLVRYAGAMESYAIRIDRSASKVRIIEHHQGRANQVAEAGIAVIKTGPIRFRIHTELDHLTAAFSSSGDLAPVVTLTYSDLKTPEGRIGFETKARAIFSDLRVDGKTESSFSTYAFRCNYRLPEKVANEPLWQYLDDLGADLLARYPKTFKSAKEFESYQQDVRLKIRRGFGLDPWPERAPLNPQTVGVLDRGDFKIEKVIFESHPGFLVNALVYLPKKITQPLPGIVSPVGHYGDDSLFIWSEQARCIGLVRKGYIVLTYDPISQGERRWLGNGNHDIIRRKILLSGMEASGLMVWDSMRAIDYLTSRPEVDPQRIGVTGVSGGGFNSLYTAVLDERVKAVAPAGFATTFEALIKRAGAGCCAYTPELARYAEISDLYGLIAPRGLLVLGGMMDVLSDRILPVAEAIKAAYAVVDAQDQQRYFVDPDAGHTYSKPMRLEMYRAFNKWLKGIDDPAASSEPKDPEDSLISRDSGLLKIIEPPKRGKDIIDLERTFLAKRRVTYTKPENAGEVREFQTQLRKRLTDLMGDMPTARVPILVSDDRQSGPNSVRKIVVKTERNLPVGITISHPREMTPATAPLLIYFSMEERYPTSDVSRPIVVDRLKSEGYVVAVPEVRGTGGSRVSDMNSVALYSLALGKHLYSARIYDLQRVIDYLQSLPEYKSRRVIVWGEGLREGPMAFYLAALDSRIDTVVSSHGLVTYQNIVDEDGLPDWDYYVPGLLLHADVPELISAIAPRRVLLSSPVTISGKIVDQKDALARYTWASDVYQTAGAPKSFEVVSQVDLLAALRR